ncbi:GFA family protein [Thioclava sp. BHET1]|nr:GFA family protein [Thioclava sp. BHET1]
MSETSESQPAPIRARCHCGAVELRLRLSDGLNTARRCSCSYCRMRGAIAVSAPLAGLEIVQGAEKLTLYQFNTGTAKHYFCSICGIYTHHQRRSDPTQFGVNAACIEGVSPFDFTEVIVSDGINHPSDPAGSSKGVSGVLRFSPD